VSFKGVINKQAATSPELQIHVRFSSNFDFYALVVRLERMGNFKWIEIVISLLVLSLTFQLKANDCVWTHFVY